jgi:hypothetical protein
MFNLKNIVIIGSGKYYSQKQPSFIARINKYKYHTLLYLKIENNCKI